MKEHETAVAELENISLRHGRQTALDQISLSIPGGKLVGVIGPDGVGKSSLLALIAGAHKIQSGKLMVLGGDMHLASHRQAISPRLAYIPQGLGRNLYPTLTVYENIDFFGRLFDLPQTQRKRQIEHLLQSTGLIEFADRPAGKLSGGMKQKLGICCSLIHDPELLVLDEPTTGVDPLSRSQFWNLIADIRSSSPHISVIVATAYMEEAEAFDWLIAMDSGKILALGSPQELMTRTNSKHLEEAFLAMMPESRKAGFRQLVIPPRTKQNGTEQPAIKAVGLTCRFGDFTAVNNVSFQIDRGEIFGFLGSNGCGKTTTMKMMTGLLPATEGKCSLFGQQIDAGDLSVRRRVGYLSQSFSLYSELTVIQNLVLHAKLFQLPSDIINYRVAEMINRFHLESYENSLPVSLPVGIRQRLSLAVATIHKPEILILDEPTSGVDPIARDQFWQLMINLSRHDMTTIFISTHFMNEAMRCDRISLMHAGHVLASGTPEELVKKSGQDSLEQAFIQYLKSYTHQVAPTSSGPGLKTERLTGDQTAKTQRSALQSSMLRLFAVTRRELLEISRDPFRLALTFLGTISLLLITSFGMSMDVKNLTFAALDRDKTTASNQYLLSLSGSPQFIERPEIKDYADMEARLKSGEISLALEIPPGFGRQLKRGASPDVAGWIDGSMPNRAATVRSYVEGVHFYHLAELARNKGVSDFESQGNIEVRFRYNPNVDSLVSIIPAMIPLLLTMIPAMLAAVGVVREKEMGSITNLYVTPLKSYEFIIGKQATYILLGMLNFIIMIIIVQYFFQVPVKGNLALLSLAAFFYVCCSTGLGMLMSVFMRTQIAAIFGVTISTMLPAVQFSGMLDPVSTLEGIGAVIGQIYPTSHFLSISRGIFCKNLELSDLHHHFLALLITFPLLSLLCILLMKKQEN